MLLDNRTVTVILYWDVDQIKAEGKENRGYKYTPTNKPELIYRQRYTNNREAPMRNTKEKDTESLRRGTGEDEEILKGEKKTKPW